MDCLAGKKISSLPSTAEPDLQPNSYFLIMPDGAPLALDLGEEPPVDVDLTYFLRSLREMEGELSIGGLVFYFVYDSTVPLPSYGPEVVVIIFGDERRRFPPYLDRVGCVFSCFGMRPVFGVGRLGSLQGLTELLDFARRSGAWLPGWLQGQIALRGADRIAPVWRIPQGYAKLCDLDVRPLFSRSCTLSFVGSLAGRPAPALSIRGVTGTPKIHARNSLVATLERMRRSERFGRIRIELTRSFDESRARGAEGFSEILMDTQICPVPRGTVPETARFYSAARYGCIIVCEQQPRSWFADSCPCLVIRDWRELPNLATGLLSDPERMERLHRQTLAWWKDICSEKAVGGFMARALAAPMLSETRA
ncbi:hypothetical protein SAMN05216548_1353 [Faunimonas pinastri]|uniref:Exostosin GT47 domain-containing protein n=1 Tax=Faunimonas pinastri TaxID=1855383 RepID=A0A1H9QTY8_9HYPH|nr:hypothetical protein [Faunimonas pinastri]SER63918.1 hypothetical protein SAMN05216548_1353 [Faunimonas pinastri]